MEILSFLMISYSAMCSHNLSLSWNIFFLAVMLFNNKNSSQVFRVSNLISTKIQARAYIGTIGLNSFGNRI